MKRYTSRLNNKNTQSLVHKNTGFLDEEETYKFGKNQIKVLDGKKSSNFSLKSFLNRLGLLNIFLIGIIFTLCLHIVNSISVEIKLDKHTRILNHELKTVKKEHEQLKKQIALYKSEEGMEKLARERLGFIKSDEIPIRYINPEK